LPPDRGRLEELGLLMTGEAIEARRLREAVAGAVSGDGTQ
jgi:hypothetical protein